MRGTKKRENSNLEKRGKRGGKGKAKNSQIKIKKKREPS